MVSDLSAGFKGGPAAPSSSMQMEGGDRSLTLGQHKGSTSRKLKDQGERPEEGATESSGKSVCCLRRLHVTRKFCKLAETAATCPW